MTGKISTNRRKRRKSNSKSKQRNRLNLQKPSAVIGPRVKRVGGEKFAIVCIDPAKQRSEWMMADYFGNLLIERQTLEHQAVFFKLAVMQIREAQQQHEIQDMIVVVERTGKPDSIMEKLREFHRVHQTPMDQVLADLKTTVGQLPYNTRSREAEVVAEVLRQHACRRRGSVAIGALLPAVLARLEIKTTEDNENRDRP